IPVIRDGGQAAAILAVLEDEPAFGTQPLRSPANGQAAIAVPAFFHVVDVVLFTPAVVMPALFLARHHVVSLPFPTCRADECSKRHLASSTSGRAHGTEGATTPRVPWVRTLGAIRASPPVDTAGTLSVPWLKLRVFRRPAEAKKRGDDDHEPARHDT